MDDLFEALGSEVRVRVIEHLRFAGRGVTQAELRDALDVPRSRRGTLSKHMARLEQAALVSRADDTYRLRYPEMVGNLLTVASQLARTIASERADEQAARARAHLARTMRSANSGGAETDLATGR